jgi:hypothetical protein
VLQEISISPYAFFLLNKIMLLFRVSPINLPPMLLVLFPMAYCWYNLHNTVMGGSCLRYVHSAWGMWSTFCLGVCSTRWPPLGTAGANGRSKLHSLLSFVLYPKHVCFAFLTLQAEYWGPGQ